MAVKLLKIEQGSPEWLNLRRLHRTASETPIVMQKSRYKAPLALAREKRGLDAPEKENKAMKFGLTHEAGVRLAISQKLGIGFEPHVIVDGPYLASLDGFNFDCDTILEIKCPFRVDSRDLLEAREEKVPESHWWQIQHQLMVSEAKLCHYVVRDAADGNLITLEVKPSKTAFSRIREEWDLFWEAFMECPAEELIQFQEIPSDLRSKVDDFLRAKDMKEEGVQMYNAAREVLTEELPEDSEGFNLRVLHIEQRGSIDWKAVEKAHPEINFEQYRKPTKVVVRINDRRK